MARIRKKSRKLVKSSTQQQNNFKIKPCHVRLVPLNVDKYSILPKYHEKNLSSIHKIQNPIEKIDVESRLLLKSCYVNLTRLNHNFKEIGDSSSINNTNSSPQTLTKNSAILKNNLSLQAENYQETATNNSPESTRNFKVAENLKRKILKNNRNGSSEKINNIKSTSNTATIAKKIDNSEPNNENPRVTLVPDVQVLAVDNPDLVQSKIVRNKQTKFTPKIQLNKIPHVVASKTAKITDNIINDVVVIGQINGLNATSKTNDVPNVISSATVKAASQSKQLQQPQSVRKRGRPFKKLNYNKMKKLERLRQLNKMNALSKEKSSNENLDSNAIQMVEQETGLKNDTNEEIPQEINDNNQNSTEHNKVLVENQMPKHTKKIRSGTRNIRKRTEDEICSESTSKTAENIFTSKDKKIIDERALELQNINDQNKMSDLGVKYVTRRRKQDNLILKTPQKITRVQKVKPTAQEIKKPSGSGVIEKSDLINDIQTNIVATPTNHLNVITSNNKKNVATKSEAAAAAVAIPPKVKVLTVEQEHQKTEIKNIRPKRNILHKFLDREKIKNINLTSQQLGSKGKPSTDVNFKPKFSQLHTEIKTPNKIMQPNILNGKQLLSSRRRKLIEKPSNRQILNNMKANETPPINRKKLPVNRQKIEKRITNKMLSNFLGDDGHSSKNFCNTSSSGQSVASAEITKETFFRGLQESTTKQHFYELGNEEITNKQFFRESREVEVSDSFEFKFGLGKNISNQQQYEKEEQTNKTTIHSTMETKTSGKETSNKITDKTTKKTITEVNKLIDTEREDATENISKKISTNIANNRKNTFSTNLRNRNKIIQEISEMLENDTNNNDNFQKIPEKNLIKKPVSKKNDSKSTAGNKKRQIDANDKDKNMKTSEVYDFPTSQDNNGLTTPNAKNWQKDDVLFNLYKQGKIEIAKYKKGSGRLQNRFKRPPIKSTIKNTIKLTKTMEKKPLELLEPLEDDEHVNDADNFDDIQELNEKITLPIPPKTPTTYNKASSFSTLARSVMKISAANKNSNDNFNMLLQREPVTDKLRLLEAAKNFVGIKNTNVSQEIDRSIVNESSPWRCENLPQIYSYPSNPTNFPSFSSEVLYPETHGKSIPRNYSLNDSNVSSNLNASNMENLYPENKFNMIETNPRKGLKNRSPLKNINILEVRTLPNIVIDQYYKTNSPSALVSNAPQTTEPSVSIAAISNENANLSANNSTATSNPDTSIDNLFGFGDDIVEIDSSDEIKSPPNIISKNKLKKALKRLVPPNRSKIHKPVRICLNAVKELYKNDSPIKQKTVQEMFCSTMIGDGDGGDGSKQKDTVKQPFFDLSLQQSKHEAIIEEEALTLENQSIEDEEHTDGNSFKLFNDFIEESTLNSPKKKVKTYTHSKLKRKKMRHQFITFLESDSDDDNGEEELSPKKKIKKGGATKTHQKQNVELDEFIEIFNSMCEEVDNFELRVEVEK